MRRTAIAAVETLVAAGSLAGIVWVIAGFGLERPVFAATAALMCVLFVLCYLTPVVMVRVISMPFAFRLSENVGRNSFAMQSVTYASFHTRLLANLTHLGLAADAVAWVAVVWLFAGWWGLVALAFAKALQIMSYGSKPLAGLLSIAWLAVGVAAVVLTESLGRERAIALAATTIIAMAAWRVVGHVTEPVPPGVSGTYGFVPLEDLGVKPTLGVSAVVGYVAEAASGLPFRLFDPWLVDMLVRHGGLEVAGAMSRDEVLTQRRAIFESGWGAADSTAYLLTIDDPAATVKNRPTSLPPFPSGWYAVAFSDDLAPGAIESKEFCGEDVVVFRSIDGTPVVMGAHCPHLGAHLGIGGTVREGGIRCAFHGFSFDSTGACTATGYGSAAPSRLSARTWPVVEDDGVVFAWHHPLGDAPTFDLPLAEPEGWGRLRVRRFVIRDHPQETTENSVDLGHFAIVHGYGSVEMLEPVRTEGPVLRSSYTAERRMPWTGVWSSPVRFEFAPEIHGLGYSLVRVRVPHMGLTARLLVLATPMDGIHVELRLGLRLAHIEHRGALHPMARLVPRRLLESVVSRLILRSFAADASDDFPIWENKAYVEQLRLAAGDGPIGRYRAWARQFYAVDLRDAVESEQSEATRSSLSRRS